MRQFEDIIQYSEKIFINEESEKNVIYTRQSIKKICEIVNNILAKYMVDQAYMDFTEKEFDEMGYDIYLAIESVLRGFLEKLSEAMPLEEDGHVLNTYQTLLYNPNLLKEIYNKIKDKDVSKPRKLQLDMNKNLDAVVMQVLSIYREIKETISDKEMQIYRAYKQNPKYKKMIQNQLGNKIKKFEEKLIYAEDENKVFEEYFKSTRNEFFKNVKQKYIQSLLQVTDILNQFEFFEEYQEQMNKDLKSIGLEQFQYEVIEEKPSTKNLEEIFSEENLIKLPIPALLGLNAFWMNRLTKAMENINRAQFICKDLNIFEKMARNQAVEISQNQINAEMLKTEVLKNLGTLTIKEIETDASKQKSEGIVEIDMKPYLKGICSEYQEKYREYFEKTLPETTNILGDDMMSYITTQNMIVNTYKGKNAIQFALIEQATMRNTISNWGYIEDEKDTGENYILIGFDIEGLNMPVRLHMKKKELKEFLDANELDNKIPIYLGNEDFKIQGKQIQASMIIPLDKERIETLQHLDIDIQKEQEQARYIEHCRYLIHTTNSHFPNHLKKIKTIGKGKNSKTKRTIEKQYIDIETKKKYSLNNDGKYIEIPEEKLH